MSIILDIILGVAVLALIGLGWGLKEFLELSCNEEQDQPR